ncbi:MAG: helix-turn-helix domain-containing protein [Desulfatibacillaceae bacterium]
MTQKREIDWELARERYAAGLPVVEIARMAGVSPSTVYGRVRTGEWKREEPAKSRLKGGAKRKGASKTAAGKAGGGRPKAVKPEGAEQPGGTESPALAEEFTRAVEDAEPAGEKARDLPPEALCQAGRISRALAIADRLMEHLEEQGVHGRVDAGQFRALVSGLSRLVALERQALGLDDRKEDPHPPVRFVLEM